MDNIHHYWFSCDASDNGSALWKAAEQYRDASQQFLYTAETIKPSTRIYGIRTTSDDWVVPPQYEKISQIYFNHRNPGSRINWKKRPTEGDISQHTGGAAYSFGKIGELDFNVPRDFFFSPIPARP